MAARIIVEHRLSYHTNMPKRLPASLEVLSEGSQEFLDIIQGESDLAIALIGASYLDHCLGATLRSQLKPGAVTDGLLEPNGALGAFGARIDLCFALGSFSETTHRDLKTIAKIRNLFAHHHLTLTFADAGVQAECRRLKYIEEVAAGIERPNPFRDALEDPRDRFILTLVLLSGRLVVHGLGARSLHDAT